MQGIDPELKALVDSARGSDDPTAADRKRVTTALAVRLGAGALVSAAVVTAATKAAAATSGLALTAKVVGAVLAAGLIGVAASPDLRRAMLPSSPRPAEVRAVQAPRRAPPRPMVEPLPSAVPPREAAALEREVRLLRQAQQALRDGRAEQALVLVREHEASFPQGTLREERMAARVMALCALGRMAEARETANEFLRRWPHSPLSAQARAGCARDLKVGRAPRSREP